MTPSVPFAGLSPPLRIPPDHGRATFVTAQHRRAVWTTPSSRMMTSLSAQIGISQSTWRITTDWALVHFWLDHLTSKLNWSKCCIDIPPNDPLCANMTPTIKMEVHKVTMHDDTHCWVMCITGRKRKTEIEMPSECYHADWLQYWCNTLTQPDC